MGRQKKEMVIPQEITNPEDDTANTWNHYCKFSQDQQAMKAMDQSQSVEKFKATSTKLKVNQAEKFKIKFYEQLQTVASKSSNEGIVTKQNFASSYGLQHQRRATKGLQLIKICEQLWTAASKASKGRAMKGLQLIVSSYGLQHQKHKKASNERIAANREQLWTAALKTSKGEQ